MHGDANLMRMTFFNRRARDGPERIDWMIFVHDVPDLHQIWLLFCKFAHELARLIGSVDLYNRRITEIEFLSRDARNQRPRYGDARRFRGCVRLFADLKIPHRSTDIDHAGDAAANVARKDIVQM